MTALPLGWAIRKIGELCELNPSRPNDLADDDTVTFLPMSKVAEETGCIDTSEGRLFGELRQKSYRPFRDGDVLFAKITPCMENGKCAVAHNLRNGYGFGSTEFFVLRANDAIDARFLRYFIVQPAFRNAAARRMTGTAGQLRVAASFMRAASIPVPPIPEQRRIVEAIEEQFSHLDAAEASLKHAMSRVKLASEFAFTSVVGFNSASYSPLGDIAEIVGGITKDSKRETDSNFIEAPYLRVANVQRGYLDLSDVTTIRVDRAKADKLRLMAGDILFNEGGDRDKLGRGWVWEGQIEGCIHQNHVFRARVDVNVYEPKFISLYGNSIGRQWFSRMGRQTTNLASLNLTTLKSFPIPRVSIEDQRRVVAETERQLSVYQRIAAELDGALSRSLRLRRAVLEAAFSGRLVARGEPHTPACLEAAAREGRHRSLRRKESDGVAIAAAESEIRV